jgi:hypothetical protein
MDSLKLCVQLFIASSLKLESKFVFTAVIFRCNLAQARTVCTSVGILSEGLELKYGTTLSRVRTWLWARLKSRPFQLNSIQSQGSMQVSWPRLIGLRPGRALFRLATQGFKVLGRSSPISFNTYVIYRYWNGVLIILLKSEHRCLFVVKVLRLFIAQKLVCLNMGTPAHWSGV